MIQVDMAGEIHSTASTASEYSDAASSKSVDPSEAIITQPRPPKKARNTNLKPSTMKKKGSQNDDIEAQKGGDGAASNMPEASAFIVTDLGVYKGETLAEQVESFIHMHPVVMFNRTWCLFSVDAMDFMVKQLQVSVHSLEVDIHPKGKEIIKYISQKTGQNTTPAIFIRGEFLGGFEEVNSLYATGALQRDYLGELSQADKCEEFINKAKLTTKPLFWFPEQVDAHVIRIGGLLICGTSLATSLLVYWYSWGAYLSYGLAIDFLLRVLAGSFLSPLGRIAWLLAKLVGSKPRAGRPKQFAALCGLFFSTLASILYAIPVFGTNIAGSIVLALLACAAGMEGFLDFCVGCVVFKWGVKLGLISK
jgi:glutaredoxin